jgi:hypothetical protein
VLRGLFSGGLRVEHADLRNSDEHRPGNDGLFDVFDAALRSDHACSRKAGCTGARHTSAEHARRDCTTTADTRGDHTAGLDSSESGSSSAPRARTLGDQARNLVAPGVWPDGQMKCRGNRRRRLGTFGGFSFRIAAVEGCRQVAHSASPLRTGRLS